MAGASVGGADARLFFGDEERRLGVGDDAWSWGVTVPATTLRPAAHPTEVHRRTLLAKHRRVAELLGALESATGEFARAQVETELSGVVSASRGRERVVFCSFHLGGVSRAITLFRKRLHLPRP